MASFIYDTGLPWSFKRRIKPFTENIVFHCCQGGAIRNTGIFVRPIYIYIYKYIYILYEPACSPPNVYAPIKVNPVGGSAGKGWGFDKF